LIRAIEFLLLHPDTDAALSACDSKPLGLLRLISDEVPFEFIQRMMNADETTKKYDNVFEFFKRIALKATEHTQLSKAAKVFSASFGGSAFEQNERNHQHPLVDTAVHKQEHASAVAAVSAIPYRKWTPRVAAMSARSLPMSTVTEDDEEEDDNEEPNENKDPSDNVIIEADKHHPTTSIKVMTASEKLRSACFGMVIRNSCKQVNCEYSHDKAIIAAARDKQIADQKSNARRASGNHEDFREGRS
jgi:hypothetical protein